MADVQVKTPGKLYIAGEYAVVEPGYSAIVASVDSFIHLFLQEANTDFGTIYSKGFTSEPVSFIRENDQVLLDHSKEELQYVKSAIEVTEEYLKEKGISLTYYTIQIHSELINETGRKLGLGSSGAVTVAVVQALLKFYKVDFSDLIVYKLSVLAQLRLGINSSYGDLASIAYTSWIKYTSPDREAVKAYQNKHSIKETVEWTWPYLAIEPLKVSKDLYFLIGWTGSPASSDELVGSVQKNKSQSPKQYQDFLHTSQQAVDSLTTALQTLNRNQLIQSIEMNRLALKEMGKQTGVLIETEQLSQLCEIAQAHGGVAKTSGAGGGDSGIAFIFEEEKVEAIVTDWEKAGITNLPLEIYSK